jgi:hypothetical protein
MPTKSVALICSKPRGSTVEKEALGARDAVTVVPSALTIEIDFASMLPILPRITTGGGASAPSAEALISVKNPAPKTSERMCMMVPTVNDRRRQAKQARAVGGPGVALAFSKRRRATGSLFGVAALWEDSRKRALVG